MGVANGEEGAATDEVVRLVRGNNPLERETWTWQQDETSLQGNARSKPSRACETLRAERRWAWDACRWWTRRADVAKRSENPKEGARGRGSCVGTALMLGPT